jgi:hypothetical protein
MMSRYSFFITVLLATAGCGPSGSQDNGAQSEVLELKRRWKAKAEAYSDSKDFPTYAVVTLRETLESGPTNVVASEFRRLCSVAVPEASEHPEDLEKSYDKMLLEALVDLCVRQKDGPRLTALLRNNCPQSIGLVPLEYWLANAGWEESSGWPEAIPLLLQAYDEAKSRRVRTDIIVCVGRAFPSLRSRFPEDKVFIREAGTWYKQNNSQLHLNHQYPYLPSQPEPLRDKPNPRDLFILRK